MKSQNKILLIFSIIAYGVTWPIAFGIYFLLKKVGLSNDQINLYHSLAAIGPAVAAFFTAYIFYGQAGVKKLLSKIKLPVLNTRTILLVVSPLLFFAASVILFRAINSGWYSFENFALTNWISINSLIIWSLPLFTYSIFEEIGWRGFLLPHLQEKYSAWWSTVFLTIIWALWHIPFFLYRFDFSLGISIGFFVGIFIGSIILTSIYNSSRGLVIPVMLFHFLNNLGSAFDKEIFVAVLSTGFVFAAIYIYQKFGRENLCENKRTKNYFLG